MQCKCTIEYLVIKIVVATLIEHSAAWSRYHCNLCGIDKKLRAGEARKHPGNHMVTVGPT